MQTIIPFRQGRRLQPLLPLLLLREAHHPSPDFRRSPTQRS
eukprot:COSAG04_NODE_28159_length_277_cov_0.876404_2_plen_40_part_01